MNKPGNHNALIINNLTIGYPSGKGETPFRREFINFSARQGEMVALIGPNGTGKSTLLRTMAGLLRTLDGTILLDGRPLGDFSRKELARTLSFVATGYVEISHMTTAEMVAFGRYPYTNWRGTLSDRDRRKVLESMEHTGLLPLAQRQVSQLSDGERQRVLIARALAQDTPFILLDEPTAFLDVNNKYEVFHLLHQLAHIHRKIILLSTHDLEIALREMDKLWILTPEGSLEGAPEDAVLNGWLRMLFNNPRMDFDPKEGSFRFVRETAGIASLEGDEPTLLWTRRALERRGFSIGDKSMASLHVRIQSGDTGHPFWLMNKNNLETRFTSIHGLMEAL